MGKMTKRGIKDQKSILMAEAVGEREGDSGDVWNRSGGDSAG